MGNLRLTISDRELWAVSLHVHRQHGDNANLFVADRIGTLALVGDTAGIAIWKEVAKRLEELDSDPGPPH